MLEGRIVVEYTSVQKGLPETTAVPLITIMRRTDRKYVITGAIDPRTAERVDLKDAVKRGLIDPQTGEFVNDNKGGERIPESEAVEDGWILADFDNTNPAYESETFAVAEVLDDKYGVFMTFMQAVRRGLVDPETGNYVSRKTGKKIYAADAIRRGLIKAKKCSSNITESDVFKAAVRSFKDTKHDTSVPNDAVVVHPTTHHTSPPITTITPNGDISSSQPLVKTTPNIHLNDSSSVQTVKKH